MQWGVQDEIPPPPRTPRPPRKRLRRWLDRFISILSYIAFIVFVCWLANGAAAGGRVLWIVVALFATPIVLYLLFIAAVGFAFVREGKRNVREAQRRRREGR